MSEFLSGEDEFVPASEEDSVQGWLDSGNYALNWAVGGRLGRGWPLGTAAEIYGESGTGKSYLIFRAIAELQKQAGHTVLDDTEGAFYRDWVEKIGVDPDDLLVTHSHTVKDHYEKVVKVMAQATGEAGPYLLALDSLGELTTEHEQKVGLDKPSVGSKAKKLRTLFRLIGEKITSLPMLYIIANHSYESISAFSNRPRSSGGQGLEYKAHVRVHLKSTTDIKAKGGRVVGVRIKGRCVKNRIVGHGREFEIAVPFDRPVSKVSGLIPLLLELDILGTEGYTLTYKGEDTGIYAQKSNPDKRLESAKELLDEHPDLIEEADKMIEEMES